MRPEYFIKETEKTRLGFLMSSTFSEGLMVNDMAGMYVIKVITERARVRRGQSYSFLTLS
jgi:hypothetical protein